MLKDIKADLGGWVDFDGHHLGKLLDLWKGDMKGQYLRNTLLFSVLIRSGLEWNRRCRLSVGSELLMGIGLWIWGCLMLYGQPWACIMIYNTTSL